MTIYDIAKECFASTTSLSRIPKLLDCKNFTEFKVALSASYLYHQALRASQSSKAGGQSRLNTVADNPSTFLQQVDATVLQLAVETMRKAKKISLFVPATQQTHALQRSLFMDGKVAANLVPFPEEQSFVKTMDEGDLIVVFLNAQDQLDMKRDMLIAARERGIRTVAIISSACRGWNSDYLDYPLLFQCPDVLNSGPYLELYLLMLTELYDQI